MNHPPPAAARAGTERFNSVVPELGSHPDWDRNSLTDLLHLQPTGPGTFCTDRSLANAFGVIFGGQMVGQALVAAAHDVAPEAVLHSLQINFLKAGQADQPLHYTVQPLMQGRTFAVMQVQGRQGERLVIQATASFQRPEAGPAHQLTGPLAEAPDPDSLPTLAEVVSRNAHLISPEALDRMAAEHTVDLRPWDAQAFLFSHDPSAHARYWVRVRPALPDDARLQQAALGYLSDYWFPLTALSPHIDRKIGSGLHVASLNHTVWFHQPARADEWLLVDARSHFTGQSRGLTFGQVYRRDGTLVASLAQEGLYRGWQQGAEGFVSPTQGGPNPP